MQKEEVLKEFDRQFGSGASLPRLFLEILLDIRDQLIEANEKLEYVVKADEG